MFILFLKNCNSWARTFCQRTLIICLGLIKCIYWKGLKVFFMRFIQIPNNIIYFLSYSIVVCSQETPLRGPLRMTGAWKKKLDKMIKDLVPKSPLSKKSLLISGILCVDVVSYWNVFLYSYRCVPLHYRRRERNSLQSFYEKVWVHGTAPERNERKKGKPFPDRYVLCVYGLLFDVYSMFSTCKTWARVCERAEICGNSS